MPLTLPPAYRQAGSPLGERGEGFLFRQAGQQWVYGVRARALLSGECINCGVMIKNCSIWWLSKYLFFKFFFNFGRLQINRLLALNLLFID